MSTPAVSVTGNEAYGFVAELIQFWARQTPHVGGYLQIAVDSHPDIAEGAFRVTANRGDSGTTAKVEGGTRSGVVYGVRSLFETLRNSPDSPSIELSCEPALPYRLFWTWDHSTNWDLLSVGQQESGAFNGYEKQPEAFVDGYKRLVDFMSIHRITGVVVYGLLRDGHGGVEAAQEICRYARDRGVRLIAGIAANAYGGIYYEGDHDYNLSTWLDRHPELEASFDQMPGFHIDDYGRVPFPKGPLSRAALSDAPENLEWTIEGLAWLLETVEPGGINIEFGDYAGNDPIEDMRVYLPAVIETVRKHDPTLPVITDLGWDALLDPELPGRLEGLPPECIYEFTFNKSYWDRLHSELTAEMVERLPMPLRILRGQIGTQWNQQRYSYMALDFADMALLARRTGMDGISMFSEVSDFSPPNEFNYLAFARFGYEADIDWDRFTQETLEPALGGPDAAWAYAEMALALDSDPDEATIEQFLPRAREYSESADGDVRRRWIWLENELMKRRHWQRVVANGAL